MRIVMIAGSHRRHLYIAERLAETGVLVGILMEKREEMLCEPPQYLDEHTTELYNRHFEIRLDMERKYFGSVNEKNLRTCINVYEVESSELNSDDAAGFIKSCRPDILVSYGPGLIHENILNVVGGNAVNIHGGLSPYYKGSATMFWPFYFLEPNYVGTTIHYISKKIDGGAIIHQVVPKLEYGDCMHEVSCKAIAETGNELAQLVRIMESREIGGKMQKRNGKLFLKKDWRPEHLKLIYDVYEDKITDLYLDGVISRYNEPKLIRAW